MSGAEPWNNDFNLTERLTLLDYHNSTQSKTETKVYILNAIDPFQVNALTIQIKGKPNRLLFGTRLYGGGEPPKPP